MSTAQIETVTSTADKAKLAAAVRLWCWLPWQSFYLLSAQGALAQWGACWVVWLVGCGGVSSLRYQGKQLIGFGRDAWREVLKVVWPTRKEAMQMTAYVFGFVLHHGGVFVVDGQNLGMGVVRPDSGMEKIMTEESLETNSVTRAARASRHALVCGACLFRHGKGCRAQHRSSASTAQACNLNLAVFWFPPKKWSK